MTQKLTWFNLINKFQEAYYSNQGCIVGYKELDEVVENLTWYNLNNKFKELVRITNEQVTTESFTVEDLVWRDILTNMQKFLEFIEVAECIDNNPAPEGEVTIGVGDGEGGIPEGGF